MCVKQNHPKLHTRIKLKHQICFIRSVIFAKIFNVIGGISCLISRPGVAVAVLQSPLLLINSVSQSVTLFLKTFKTSLHPNRKSQGTETLRICSPTKLYILKGQYIILPNTKHSLPNMEQYILLKGHLLKEQTYYSIFGKECLVRNMGLPSRCTSHSPSAP